MEGNGWNRTGPEAEVLVETAETWSQAAKLSRC